MNNYKIYNSSWSVVKPFATLEDAEAWRDANKPQLEIEDLGAVPLKSDEELYNSDVSFCKGLIDNFNLLNRKQPQTPEEMAELQAAFENIAVLANVGAVNYVRASIAVLFTPIGGVYTAERKAADLASIDTYLLTRLYI